MAGVNGIITAFYIYREKMIIRESMQYVEKKCHPDSFE